MGGLNLKVCQNFVGTKFFLRFVEGINLYGGEICITTISLFHFLEIANTQKSEVFLLRISSGNVNASVVATCQYPQIY